MYKILQTSVNRFHIVVLIDNYVLMWINNYSDVLCILCRTRTMLGSVCYRFTNLKALTNVYCAFALSNALRRSISRDFNYRFPYYESRSEMLGIESIDRCRLNMCASFVHYLLNYHIDAVQLLVKFRLNRPFRDFRSHSCL